MVEKLWWQTLNLNPVRMTTHAQADQYKEHIHDIKLRSGLYTLCKAMFVHLTLLY